MNWFFKIFLLRFLRRLRYAFNFKEMMLWKYESCNKCGRCFRLSTNWKDNLWIRINGKSEGTLCPECFISEAQKRGIPFDESDIESLFIFDPDKKIGGDINLL